MSDPIHILIADDHPLFRRGLCSLIESDPGMRVVREAANGAEALRLMRELKPAVAILDLDMPEMSGLETTRAAQDEGLESQIIFLTMYKEEDVFNEAMDLGARGYVLKESAVADILDCIRAVAGGRYYISPAISDFLVNRNVAQPKPLAESDGLGGLTPAERRILRQIAAGQTSKEIADALGLSTRTVENHRANICIKLNLRGIHSLVKFAFENREEI